MPIESAVRLGLIAFAVVTIAYVCIGTGLWDKSNSDWWSQLPDHKRKLFIAAIALSLLQSFI
ncbi:MAG: hypothetical protein JRG96_13240 [Deltaproteobacteria bacterium]|nr:hypothetical protein [Deltaproteobacteria bacterium]MBW2421170.1 hypothetical protein [Deltaproteobacteria bacterium]